MTRTRLPVVVLISAVCGFGLGLLQWNWQVAVEPAQVIAGLVRYPPANPFYIYEAKTWTILHQVSALGLWFGLSEKAASMILSGLAGALSLSAIAVWVYALAEDARFAVLSSLFVAFADPTGWGVNYPVMLMGQIHTYGMFGLSFICLAVGLLGAGQYRAGALLVGLAPAVHPALGVWCTLMMLACLAWDFRGLRPHLRAAVPFAVVGYAISAASFGVQLITSRGLPAIAPDAAAGYLDTFLRYWDTHRVPIDFLSINVILIVFGLIICLIGVRLLRRDAVPTSLLLRAYAAAVAIALGFYLIQQLPLNLPASLAILMPSRLLNFNVLVYLPLLLGLLWRNRDSLLAQLTLVVLVVLLGLFLPPVVEMAALIAAGIVWLVWLHPYTSLRAADPANGMRGLRVGEAIPPAARLLRRFAPRHDVRPQSEMHLGSSARLTRAARRATLGVLALAAILAVAWSVVVWSVRRDTLADLSSDPVLAEVSRGSGLVLLGPDPDLYLAQLLTRRPILLNPDALDMLPYALEGGPQFVLILRDAYGIDFDDPPRTGRHAGTLPVEPIRAVWEQRTPEQWASIKTEFAVSDVLTSADWNVHLPEVARSDRFALYRIP